jgi:tRNA threonylcarbamoyladenosine biosynthesis protein TsaE
VTSETLNYRAADERGTERLGRALAGALEEGGVIALSGPLGAGKTRLAQAIAVACGVDRRDVVSPTFVLVHEYHGMRPIYHLDAYRLRDSDEFLQLGVEEHFAPPNLVLIEWAERVADCLPRERLEIAIQVLPTDDREFALRAHGQRYAEVIERLRGQLASAVIKE